MGKHKSRTYFKNLIKDLAEMYPYTIEEAILIELIANSLDAKPTKIQIIFDHKTKIMIIEDNGEGMTEDQFIKYHDFAAGLKSRGQGIGFAGLGAKISFNIANRVITETRSNEFLGGSNWYLTPDNELEWEDIKPVNLKGYGTKVEIHFNKNIDFSYKNTEDIVNILMHNYLLLFETNFLNLYNELNIYPSNLKFIINNEEIKPIDIKSFLDIEKLKTILPKKTRTKKRIGLGLFGLSNKEYPLCNDVCGVLICSYGKIIKSEFFNQFPGEYGTKIIGLVEIPELSNFLNTSKTGFIRGGTKLEELINPIRQEFKSWLQELGIKPIEISDTEEAKKLEKEIKKILNALPELNQFFGSWEKISTLVKNTEGKIISILENGSEHTIPNGEGEIETEGELTGKGSENGKHLEENEKGVEKSKPISRTAKQGPKITFADIPDRTELAWVEGGNIVINSGYPSYKKIYNNNIAKMIHNLFAIACAVMRFQMSEEENEYLMFIDKMMNAWGKT